MFIYSESTQFGILFLKNNIVHMRSFIILTLLQPGAEIFNDRLISVSGNVFCVVGGFCTDANVNPCLVSIVEPVSSNFWTHFLID